MRGAVHTVEDIVDGAHFVSRLVNPLDQYLSAPGDAAADQLASGAVALAQWGKNARDNPRAVVDQAKRGFRSWNEKHNPYATPVPSTFGEKLQREMELGLNQGELAFDVGSLFVGGAATKGVRALRPMRAMKAEDYIAQGVPENMAAYFASPYPRKGMGSHYWGRKKALPAILGGGLLPKVVSDSPLNVLKPKGITRGQMYELHFKVDPSYHGGKISKDFGGGRWSGHELGWVKHGKLGRVWHGAPPALKQTVGGGGLLGVVVAENVKEHQP